MSRSLALVVLLGCSSSDAPGNGGDGGESNAPYVCDNQTLRLYHFDGDAESDCGKDATLMGGEASFSAGPTGFGSAYAGDAVADATLTALSRPYTLDLWFKPGRFVAEPSVLVSLGGPTDTQVQIQYAENGISLVTFGLGCATPAPSASIFLGPRLEGNRYYQVTATLGEEASLSIRGGNNESELITQDLCDSPTNAELVVGGTAPGQPAHAEIDELRISTGLR